MNGLVHPIMSMGRLIRQGYDFFLGGGGRDMYATIPGGDTARLELGHDDLIRIPHAGRSGRDKEALSVLPAVCSQEAKSENVSAVSRTMKEVNGCTMHQMFNHVNREKLYYTLASTNRYKAVWLDIPPCIWCALGKFVRSGLSHDGM